MLCVDAHADQAAQGVLYTHIMKPTHRHHALVASLFACASLLGGCSLNTSASDGDLPSSAAPSEGTGGGDHGARGATGAGGAASTGGSDSEGTGERATTTPPELGDPAFHARVVRTIRSITGDDYNAYAWDALFVADEAYTGTHAWLPGTGETSEDDSNGRAMRNVPLGFAVRGGATSIEDASLDDTSLWLGVTCSQSWGGPLYSKVGSLSGLEVFATAWSDAKAIVARFGSKLRGAWLVGHSAGALPALLAGLMGGAHRIDIYGVPSPVGTLDGDDGIAHFHTHTLDPAGTMGFVDPLGHAQIDPLSAGATLLKAGGSFAYHDYANWTAPTP